MSSQNKERGTGESTDQIEKLAEHERAALDAMLSVVEKETDPSQRYAKGVAVATECHKRSGSGALAYAHAIGFALFLAISAKRKMNEDEERGVIVGKIAKDMYAETGTEVDVERALAAYWTINLLANRGQWEGMALGKTEEFFLLVRRNPNSEEWEFIPHAEKGAKSAWKKSTEKNLSRKAIKALVDSVKLESARKDLEERKDDMTEEQMEKAEKSVAVLEAKADRSESAKKGDADGVREANDRLKELRGTAGGTKGGTTSAAVSANPTDPSKALDLLLKEQGPKVFGHQLAGALDGIKDQGEQEAAVAAFLSVLDWNQERLKVVIDSLTRKDTLNYLSVASRAACDQLPGNPPSAGAPRNGSPPAVQARNGKLAAAA